MSVDRQIGWMWVQACELLERAERMQRELVRYVGPGAQGPVWEPPVDIYETPDGLYFTFALPGVHPEEIQLEVAAGALTVTAVRTPRIGVAGSRVRRLEMPHGRFIRRIALPGARLRVAESRYINGCLEVRLVSAGQNQGHE